MSAFFTDGLGNAFSLARIGPGAKSQHIVIYDYFKHSQFIGTQNANVSHRKPGGRDGDNDQEIVPGCLQDALRNLTKSGTLFMKNISQKILAAATLTAGLTLSMAASATTMLYTDRASFLSSIDSPIIDTFNSGYGFINSNATMESLSAASINYSATGFGSYQLNIVSGGALCWGCNGSGLIDLTSTTIGSSSGVYAFGADVLSNYGYNAFATLGDDSLVNIALGSGASFFGIASDQLIKVVEIAHAHGVVSNDGSIQIDNVTVSNSGHSFASSQVPEPASVALLGLGLLGMASVRRRKTA